MKTIIIFIIVSVFTKAQWFLVDPSPTTNTLRAVQLVSSTVGYAVGDNGTILKTTDGGTTWSSQFSGTTYNIVDLSFSDENSGSVVGSFNTILRTTNGGMIWIPQTISNNDWLNCISFFDSNNGIVGGTNANFLFGVIYYTTDGGENWNGSGGQIWGYGVSEISHLDSTKAVAIYYNGNGSNSFLKSNDGGVAWYSLNDSLHFFYEFCFVDTNYGLAVGGDATGGYIYKTINGGGDWILQLSGITDLLFSVSCTGINYGTAVGDSGIILRTTNAGEDWIIQSSGTTESLLSVSFVNENDGLAVGSNGTILRTTNGGVTFVDEEKNDVKPKDFVLSQNYPNPFNPSTTIRYSIPASLNPSKGGTLVTLKVFDVLGNEVATLVDEYKSAGNYEVEFNGHSDEGENLSSGIYFYQLRVGGPETSSGQGFVETKKMILLR